MVSGRAWFSRRHSIQTPRLQLLGGSVPSTGLCEEMYSVLDGEVRTQLRLSRQTDQSSFMSVNFRNGYCCAEVLFTNHLCGPISGMPSLFPPQIACLRCLGWIGRHIIGKSHLKRPASFFFCFYTCLSPFPSALLCSSPQSDN